MTKIVIFGAGGLSRVVAHYIANDERHEIAAFTVDRDYMGEDSIDGLPVVPFDSIDSQFDRADTQFLVVLTLQRGANRFLDKQKCSEIRDKGYSLCSYISASAQVSEGVALGENVIISPQAFVEPFASIGDGVIVRSKAYIGHDVTLSDYCYIAPGASLSGNVSIGAHAFVGNGATLRGGITVGREAIVGAGTTILEDVPDRAVIKAPANVVLPVDRNRINID